MAIFCTAITVQERLGIVDALEASQAVSLVYRFGLLLVLTLVNGFAAIPLGIGLIWSVPLTVIAIGLAYKWIFSTTQRSDATSRAVINRLEMGRENCIEK